MAGESSRSPATSPGPAATAPLPPTLAENGPLEAEAVDDDDGDSAYGVSGDAGSETTSIASSVLNYRREHGRTYHSFKANEGVQYFLPNDDIELDRLDLQHHQNVLMQGNQLYSCPAGKNGRQLGRILDVGTGTGIWAVEIADEHPEASVIGVDLSPTQPDFVPPNVEFIVDDIEAEWAFKSPFDFIYMRMMTGSIKNWKGLIRQAYDNLTPGGWIELLDPSNPCKSDDGTLTEDSGLARWNQVFLEASIQAGSPMNSVEKYKDYLIEAGFVNVVQVEYKWPIGPWPKEKDAKLLGSWVRQNISNGLDGLSLALFTNVLGWSVEEVQVSVALARKDMKNPRIHAYWPAYVVYGQKPE